MRDARRAQYIARDREIRALQENLQQGRITIREFLMAAAFHFEPAEEVFRIEELAELVLPLDEARAAFQAVLEIPAPIREQLNDGAGMAAGEGVDPVPPEQELAAAQPVQELAAALPVQERAAAPPVQELAAALPVQELAAAPPVQELAAVPPVQAVPQFQNVPDAPMVVEELVAARNVAQQPAVPNQPVRRGRGRPPGPRGRGLPPLNPAENVAQLPAVQNDPVRRGRGRPRGRGGPPLDAAANVQLPAIQNNPVRRGRGRPPGPRGRGLPALEAEDNVQVQENRQAVRRGRGRRGRGRPPPAYVFTSNSESSEEDNHHPEFDAFFAAQNRIFLNRRANIMERFRQLREMNEEMNNVEEILQDFEDGGHHEIFPAPAPFVDVNRDGNCSVCWERIADTVLIQCGHIFCLPCIEAVLHGEIVRLRVCPICRGRDLRHRPILQHEMEAANGLLGLANQ